MDRLKRVQPAVFPVTMINIPEASPYFLENGIPVFLIEAGTEDIVRLEFTFRAGQVNDYQPLISTTTNMMLSEGSQNYTSEELHRLLDYYGGFLHLSVDKDRAGIVIFCLNKHIQKILELSLEVLFKPVFPEAELNALMKKRLQWYNINREKVQNLAIDKFFESIFGKHHPYGYQPAEQDFNNIGPALLIDFHTKYYTPGNMTVIVAGKIPDKTIPLLNQYFGGLKQINNYIEGNTVTRSQKRKKVFVEKPGKVQSAVRLGSTTINKRHCDYPGLKVLDSILGGYFGSRLMRNIREEKGYTYGIRSSLSSLDLSGYKVIATEVDYRNLKNALNEIYKEISVLQMKPVEKQELEVVRNYMAGELLRMFDGPFAIAESFRSAWEFGLDNSYYYRMAEKIKTIEPDEIMFLANKYYKIDELYEVTAGSK